jgi:hypothetical protein
MAPSTKRLAPSVGCGDRTGETVVMAGSGFATETLQRTESRGFLCAGRYPTAFAFATAATTGRAYVRTICSSVPSPRTTRTWSQRDGTTHQRYSRRDLSRLTEQNGPSRTGRVTPVLAERQSDTDFLSAGQRTAPFSNGQKQYGRELRAGELPIVCSRSWSAGWVALDGGRHACSLACSVLATTEGPT